MEKRVDILNQVARKHLTEVVTFKWCLGGEREPCQEEIVSTNTLNQEYRNSMNGHWTHTTQQDRKEKEKNRAFISILSTLAFTLKASLHYLHFYMWTLSTLPFICIEKLFILFFYKFNKNPKYLDINWHCWYLHI